MMLLRVEALTVFWVGVKAVEELELNYHTHIIDYTSLSW